MQTDYRPGIRALADALYRPSKSALGETRDVCIHDVVCSNHKGMYKARIRVSATDSVGREYTVEARSTPPCTTPELAMATLFWALHQTATARSGVLLNLLASSIPKGAQ